MNNRLEVDIPSHSFPHQPAPAYSSISKAVSTIALLALGYYVLTFFDAWPTTAKRSSYEILVYLIPSQAIYALQYAMTRFGQVHPDTVSFRRSDFGNQAAKAEAIQRMLGHGHIPNVLRKARSLSGLESLLPLSKEIGPPGLGNWDNSCYQNSVLQGFASLPAFDRYVNQSLQLCKDLGVTAATHQALSVFLSQLHDTTGYKPTLWTPSILKSMDSWQQQDAQEYFSRVLEAVEKEAIKCNNILKKRTGSGLEAAAAKNQTDDENVRLMQNISLDKTDESVASEQSGIEANNKTFLDPNYRNPMDGMLAQALECKTCGFSEGITLTQFSCLTLNLGLRGHSYLEDLLEDYTEAEMVDGVECPECTKAVADGRDATTAINGSDQEPSPKKRPKLKPVLRTKAKQITIGRLPKDLVIHINRSIFDDFGNQRKNTSLVRFPQRLSFLDRWCVPLDAEGDAVQAVYELKCTVTHSGRHENGHYVALGKRGKNWYCFNDEIVTQVSEEEVVGRGNAFMLFYEAVEIGTAPKPTIETTPSTESTEQTVQQSSSSSGSEEEPYHEVLEVVPAVRIPAMRTASGSINVLEPPAVNPAAAITAL